MMNTSRPPALPGVNLGGWLVLEKWMTPSVFEGFSAVNEYELSQISDGVERIKHHRATFIQEDDIKWLAQIGIKLLRLPIGYWAIEDYPPYLSARPQIDWLMDVAKKYNLQVLLDLHAAPGAQNESDHSGSGKPGEMFWYRRKNRLQTTRILQQIASEYGNNPALWGIELLNEPTVKTAWQRLTLWRWTHITSRQLRQTLPPQVRIVASDCYNPSWWSGKIDKNTLDVHHYQCFSKADKAVTDYRYHAELLDEQVQPLQRYAAQQPIIIGEWSATLPPNAMNDDNASTYCQAQLTLPAHADAWFFWSYKTEAPGTWNFRDCYENGWFDGIL